MSAVVLHACTLVEGDRILGQQMAAEHAAFADIDPAVDLGPAPAAGSRRILQYFELARIAKERAVVLDPNALREACFERATVRLSAEILHEALSAVIVAPDLEILDFSRNPLPVGKPQFRADALTSSGLWAGRWLYGENRSVPIWARVRGTNGAAGRTISTHITSDPEIKPGETVRVQVHSGGVLLEFDAAAESSGHVGETVTVRNPVTGQRFRAVVEGRGKVGIRK